MYEKLITLPLFQGMSKTDVSIVLNKTKLREIECRRNAVIVDKGQNCRGLFFLLEGEVDMITTDDEGLFSVSERLPEPYVFEPERLFGLQQRHAQRFIARSKCHLLYVRKDDILFLINESIVFRLNILNILSTLTQRKTSMLWHDTHSSVEDSVKAFLCKHSRLRIGGKVFRIKMTTLAEILNISRLEVSIALNALEDKGLLILQRGIITVPDIKQILECH